MTVKHMEEELNDLALALLKAAQAKAEADRLANEEFERQLLGIAEGDAFAIKSSWTLMRARRRVWRKKGDDSAVEAEEGGVVKEADGVTESKEGNADASKPSTRPVTRCRGRAGVHENALSAVEFDALTEEEQNTYRELG